MGLLSRATGKESEPHVLDAMGKALQGRLERLPLKKTTPYTALSLFKAYGVCRTGVCLVLKDSIYSSYASVGLGIETISIPLGELWSTEKKSLDYFKLDSAQRLEIKEADVNYWCFPLDKKEPWEAVMTLGISDISFNPESVLAILEDIIDKMLPGQNQKSAGAESEILPEKAPSPEEESAEQGGKEPGEFEGKIAEYNRIHPNFNCIVLEVPGSVEKADFCGKISSMIGTPGTVIPLPSGSPLILFPITTDRELIVHRLSRAFNTRPLLSFEAESPGDVTGRVQSLR